MPMCSIKQCGARKSKNRPNLTLHSVPKNEVLRRKWLNAIGLENINPRHKELYICSLHFEESHLNRTLDVVRLRENAVPTVFNMPSTSKHMICTQKENLDPSPKMPPITEPVPVLCENVNVHEEQVTAMSHQEKKLALTYETLPTFKNVPVFCETRNIQGKMEPKKYLLPAYDMPSASKHLICTQKENLDPSPKMPPIAEPVPVLCGNVNVHEEQVTAMSHQGKKWALTYETLPTSKNVPVFYETRNIQGKMEPKQYLFPAYDMPSSATTQDSIYQKEKPSSSSAASESSILQKNKMPLIEQPAKNKEILVPAANQVSQEFSKVKKLEKICQEQKKKIKRLQEKVRRQGKKIGNLEDILKDLKQKLIINNEQSILLEECGGSRDFLKRQIAKSKGLPLENKYSEEIRKFALTLHFLSPKAYDYIRRVYNTCLPHPRTLSKWYQNVNAEAGFTKEAFDTLKKTVEQSKPQKILCALVLDEIAIRKGLRWDPKAQKYHGRVDYGHHIDCDSAEEANQCLVLMLTCINGAWKLPIGYFFITSLSGEQKCLLVETAIQMTENTGAQVVSVTCDGPASNFSMFSALGCELNKTQENTSFQTDNKNRVHAFIDC